MAVVVRTRPRTAAYVSPNRVRIHGMIWRVSTRVIRHACVARQPFSAAARLIHRLSMYHSLMGKRPLSSELLPGTLEMLVLKALSRGEAHGYGIARYLEQASH